MKVITIYKQFGHFVADRPGEAGSPTVGRGRNPMEALGALFWHASPELSVSFTPEGIAYLNRWTKSQELHGERD